MARPHSRNAEFVAHYGNANPRVSFLEKRFKATGFVVYFRIREKLTITDDHFLDLSEELNALYLAADCWLEPKELFEVLDCMATLGEIDKDLWQLKRVVCSEHFLADISVAYKRRANLCPSINTIRQRFGLPVLYSEPEIAQKTTPTEEQVLKYAEDNHREEKWRNRKAKKFFNHFEANGWKDGQDRPIEDWRPKLAQWFEDDRQKEEQQQVKQAQKTESNGGKDRKTDNASSQTGERQDFE